MTDDLHARIAAALGEGLRYAHGDPDSVEPEAMRALMDAVQPIEDSRRRWQQGYARSLEIRKEQRARQVAAEQQVQRVREFADRDQGGLCCSHVLGDLRRLLNESTTEETPA